VFFQEFYVDLTPVAVAAGVISFRPGDGHHVEVERYEVDDEYLNRIDA
jgi:hypothetical protein